MEVAACGTHERAQRRQQRADLRQSLMRCPATSNADATSAPNRVYFKLRGYR